MRITKKNLRYIIKQSLLKEGFLSSEIKDIGTIVIEISGAKRNYLVRGVGKIEGKDCIVFKMPKIDYKSRKKTFDNLGVKKLPQKDITVKYFEKEFTLRGSATKKRANDKSSKGERFYIPLESAKKSSTIELKKEKLKTGAPSMADYAIEIGGILGGIPAIGNAADISAGVMAAIKDPPDYILSALSFLCGIPAIGIGVATVAKPIARKFGLKGAKVVGTQLRKKLAGLGIELTEKLLSKIKKQVFNLIEKLKSSDTISTACALMESSSHQLLREASCSIDGGKLGKALDTVKKTTGEILDGMAGSSTKSSAKKKARRQHTEPSLKSWFSRSDSKETLKQSDKGLTKKANPRAIAYGKRFIKKTGG